jgi:hypothetical protein
MQRAAFGTVLALLLASMTGVTRADPSVNPIPLHGPAIGNNRYQASIQSVDGVPDVDDYVGEMLPGESLSASVVAVKKSKLRPRLTLIGPDGAPVAVAVKIANSGTSAQFKGFLIPSTGPWAVRVSGAGGTEGDYAVTFSVKTTRPQTVHAHQLGDDQPTFKVEKFRGVDGGLLDLRLTWTKTSNPVELRTLTDPHGGEVLTSDGKKAVESAVTDLRRRTVSLTGIPLHVGAGDYSLRVRTLQGTSTYDAVFTVTPRTRAPARRPVVLSGVEPVLKDIATPLRGRPGFALIVEGEHFSIAPRPHVFFGDYEGGVLDVAPDGKSLTVRVPQGVPGTTVPVVVANGDGQATGRANYFRYLQPILVTDVVDDSGTPVRNVSAEGGLLVHVLGAFFEQGQKVTMGGVDARIAAVQSPGEMLVVTPAAPQGDTHVVVTDVYGGVSASVFTIHFKTPPTFDAFPYHPPVAAVNSPVLVTVKGKNFLEDDQLAFAGTPVNSTFVDDKTRTFNVPGLPEGAYAITLTDDIGTVKRGPDFFVTPPPSITAVTIVAGPHIGATKIPVSGGATIQVDGAHFHDTDAVTIGGTAVTFDSHSATRFTFKAPAGAPGDATLSVVDGAGQSATAANALRYVGYTDATSSRSPGASAADSLTADRGAVGDLDGDGKVDDLVIVSSYYTYIGTRTELTRLYFGDDQGKFVDVTATKFPAAGSDSSGSDDWNAAAVAVGDVDGTHGVDVVIAGVAPYGPNYGVYKSVRLFLNDGSGGFTQDEADAPPSSYVAGVRAVDQTGAYFVVYSAVFETGYPTSVAIGDLDHDGKPDIVVGRDHYDFRYVGIDPTQVDFTRTPAYVQSGNVNYLSVFQYRPAIKVFKNDMAHGNGFVDRTAAWMPSAGDSVSAPVPCFQTLDLALGDVDGDGNVDVVQTWDDPTTVTAFGTYSGTNIDMPRVATRVLRNNGTGVLSDVTASWMPVGSQNEFWQASRLALVDLNKDGKPDLVLLHAVGTDAFNTSPPSFGSTALRVLRNTGSAFVDVTATAIPALPGNGDNFRGDALAVRDVDGDGWPDILIGTTEPMTDADGNPLPRTRLFRGGPNFVFTLDTAFLPSIDKDTGEATDILLIGDLAGRADPSLVLLSNTTPLHSAGGEMLRVLDWNR